MYSTGMTTDMEPSIEKYLLTCDVSADIDTISYLQLTHIVNGITLLIRVKHIARGYSASAICYSLFVWMAR